MPLDPYTPAPRMPIAGGYDPNSVEDLRQRVVSNLSRDPEMSKLLPQANPVTPASAPSVPPSAVSAAAEAAPTSMMGRVGSFIKRAPIALMRGAGAVQGLYGAGDMIKNGVNVDNAENTALGALTVAAPVPGLALTTAKNVLDAGMGFAADKAVADSDPRGPATIAWQKKQAAAPAVPPAATSGQPLDETAGMPAQPGKGVTLPQPLSAPIAPPATAAAPQAQQVTAPVQTRTGPLPTLEANPNENVFNALLKFGGDMSAYRNSLVGNKQNQVDFNNAMKAGQFNIDNIAKTNKIGYDFNDEQRKEFNTQVKVQSQEALRTLASGKYSKMEEQGLRLLAGLGKTKYRPAVIYGDIDPQTGEQQKMTVAVGEDGTSYPIQMPNFNTPDKRQRYPDGTKGRMKDGSPATVKNGVLVRD